MTAKVFVDTNILVYAHDVDQGSKHQLAKQLLKSLWLDGTGVLSPQVLQEFYVTVTRKIATPLSRRVARDTVADFSPWSIDIAATDVLSALRIEAEARISFWDSLILASALKARAGVVVSEDMNAGQHIAGIRIENPFMPGSSLAVS